MCLSYLGTLSTSVLRPINNGEEGRAVHGHHSPMQPMGQHGNFKSRNKAWQKGSNPATLPEAQCKEQPAGGNRKLPSFRLLPRLVLLRSLAFGCLLSLAALAQNGKRTDDRAFPPRVHRAHPFVFAPWQSESRLSLPLHPRARWGTSIQESTCIENLVVAKRRPSRETRLRHTVPSTSSVNRDLTSQSRLGLIL